MPGDAPAPIPVSVVVLTRNEAVRLPGCLATLRDFAEVVVVDSDSDDGTQAIARRAGARVVDFRWDGRYPKKKQWSLEHADLNHRFVLMLDADERLTPALTREIRVLMAQGPDAAGYFIAARNSFAGQCLRFGVRNKKLALIDRWRARFPVIPDLDVTAMGEVEGHYQPALAGPTGQLRAAMRHEAGDDPQGWLARHLRYAEWEARLRADGRATALWATEGWGRRLAKRVLHRIPLRPLFVFVHGYIWHLGLLDGRAGFDFALARALYYWQVGLLTRHYRRRCARHDRHSAAGHTARAGAGAD